MLKGKKNIFSAFYKLTVIINYLKILGFFLSKLSQDAIKPMFKLLYKPRHKINDGYKDFL